MNFFRGKPRSTSTDLMACALRASSNTGRYDCIGSQDPAQMRLAQNDKMVQALAPDRADQPISSQISRSADISMNTVRFHLKNAFAGTDTHSQAELMRVALSALNALETHFGDRN